MLSCLPPAIPKPALLEETSWVEPVDPGAKAIATPGKRVWGAFGLHLPQLSRPEGGPSQQGH